MKTFCFTLLFLGVFQVAIAADSEKLGNFPVSKEGTPSYSPSVPDSNEIERELSDCRKDLGVTALEKPESGCSLSFQVFVMPAFGRREYCVSGKLFLRANDAKGSTISLRYIKNEKVEEQHWDLTSSQAKEVLKWFSKPEFYGAKTPATVPTSVMDGVAIGIEGYVAGRNFKILRNAYDSPESLEFYRSVDTFRIWKAPADQKPEKPTATSVATPAAQK